MLDPFLGQIELFPFSFAPRGYAFCQGQVLPISQNTALFSLLGTQYGGNGTSTFALPNLNGFVPMGIGLGPGLPDYSIGELIGTENATLDLTQIPAHTHPISVTNLTATPRCRNAVANRSTPTGNVPAIEASGVTATYSDVAPDATMNASNPAQVLPGLTLPSGSGIQHTNMQPYLALNYCIALQGIYPQRP